LVASKIKRRRSPLTESGSFEPKSVSVVSLFLPQPYENSLARSYPIFVLDRRALYGE
jgi:hypothetical protein